MIDAPNATSACYRVDYAELAALADEHDRNAEDIIGWAGGDQDFAERYLQTHGTVNYGTYLKIREFLASRSVAGAAFAERNASTSAALRASIAVTSATDDANAAALPTDGS